MAPPCNGRLDEYLGFGETRYCSGTWVLFAGGSELATCCDLVYIAEDAQMGYPATVLVFQICISIHGF